MKHLSVSQHPFELGGGGAEKEFYTGTCKGSDESGYLIDLLFINAEIAEFSDASVFSAHSAVKFGGIVITLENSIVPKP
jgi:hypothetical protein